MSLPKDADEQALELVLIAENVFRMIDGPKDAAPFALSFQGTVECEELRVGDEVMAMLGIIRCRGVIASITSYLATTLPATVEVVHRGHPVSVLIKGWAKYNFGPGSRLYLLPSGQPVS
jgi:hypothetical protein